MVGRGVKNLLCGNAAAGAGDAMQRAPAGGRRSPL